MITAEATMESDQLKLLARAVQPIDEVVADAGSAGLRIFVDASEAIATVASVLDNAARTVTKGGRGPVHFCLMDPGLPGEVEVATGRVPGATIRSIRRSRAHSNRWAVLSWSKSSEPQVNLADGGILPLFAGSMDPS